MELTHSKRNRKWNKRNENIYVNTTRKKYHENWNKYESSVFTVTTLHRRSTFYQFLSTSRHVHWQHFLSPTRRGINEAHLHGNIRTLGRRVVELSLKKSSRVEIDEFIAVTRRKSVRNYVDILFKSFVQQKSTLHRRPVEDFHWRIRRCIPIPTKANIFWWSYEWPMKNVAFLGYTLYILQYTQSAISIRTPTDI